MFLPKFKLTQQFDLSDILSKIGAEEIFIPGKANLSGIKAEPLFVPKVAQIAFVKVNEEGTEAGAVGVEYLDKCVTESQWLTTRFCLSFGTATLAPYCSVS